MDPPTLPLSLRSRSRSRSLSISLSIHVTDQHTYCSRQIDELVQLEKRPACLPDDILRRICSSMVKIFVCLSYLLQNLAMITTWPASGPHSGEGHSLT